MTETEKFLSQGAIVEVHMSQGDTIIACLIELSPGGVLFYLGATVGVKQVKCFVPWNSVRMLKNTDLLTLPKGEVIDATPYLTYPREGGGYP